MEDVANSSFFAITLDYGQTYDDKCGVIHKEGALL